MMLSSLRKVEKSSRIATFVILLLLLSFSGVRAGVNNNGCQRQGYRSRPHQSRQPSRNNSLTKKTTRTKFSGGESSSSLPRRGRRQQQSHRVVKKVVNSSTKSSSLHISKTPLYELDKKRLEKIVEKALEEASKQYLPKYKKISIWFGVVTVTSLVEGFVLGYLAGFVWSIPQIIREQQSKNKEATAAVSDGTVVKNKKHNDEKDKNQRTWYGRSFTWARKYCKISMIMKVVSILPNLMSRIMASEDILMSQEELEQAFGKISEEIKTRTNS